ncbi:hypothetical protein BELL_0187g00030 [Botrytis elliptica]|uniref:Uncharacterized protein n=1 Tax=Botrytis elliptica TaxID=278938 RepID=A0A4Z1JW41_9HELO|nr:hypothetical protein EAE99_008057 [Botrytis elliptica]TGO75870.1 hypothetical protein BELL_0187g00030 [Botrytis elliptica]
MASHPLNSQAQFPYLEKVSELAKENPRYSAIGSEILTTDSHAHDGGWAIINDMSSDAGVLPESSKFTFDTEHSKSSFNSKLRNIPSLRHTRVILFLTCDISISKRNYREFYRPQIVHPATAGILGSLYKVLPSFFYHVLDPIGGYPKDRSSWAAGGKLDGVEQYLKFGFEYSTEHSTPCCTVYCIKNATFNTVVINYHKLLFRNVDKDRGIPKTAEEFLHAITRLWGGMTNSEVESAVENPLELLVPVIKDMEDYFSRDVEYMNWSLQSWISDLDYKLSAVSRAHQDDTLLKAWHNGRGSLESFEKITSRIEDYQDQMIAQGVIEYGHNDNQKIKNMLRQHRKSLKEAYRLEQHVRDTLQMNVGNLSLKESRKSLEKANSLGRLSILAFVFLPFSLVTSFFGMNISEMTGSGASWKVFLIVAAILCSLGVVFFLWIFRKSPRVMRFLSACSYPPIWVLHRVNKKTFNHIGLRLWCADYIARS